MPTQQAPVASGFNETDERRVPSIVAAARVAGTQEDDATARDATKQFDRLAGLQLDFKRKLLFYLMLGVLHVVSLIPDFVLYPLGIAGGYIIYFLDPPPGKTARNNLSLSFPEPSSPCRPPPSTPSYVTPCPTATPTAP